MEEKRGRQKGCPKTGGRKKGMPNKSTLAFGDVLKAKGFSIPDKAMELFHTVEGEGASELRLEILKFLATYTHSKPKIEIDQIPWNSNPYLKLSKEEFIAGLPIIDVEAQPATT